MGALNRPAMKAWEQGQALQQQNAPGGLGGLLGGLGNFTLGVGQQNDAFNNIVYQQYTGVTTTKNAEVAWLTRRVKEVSWYGDKE